MPGTPHPTLALLAGGRGTRMGLPKSHLTIANVPILRHLLAQWSWPGPTLLITAPGVERPPAHDLFTAEHVDPVADQGPLRGIHTALTHATTDTIIVATVDMPRVTRAHLDHLTTTLATHPTAPALFLHPPFSRDPKGERQRSPKASAPPRSPHSPTFEPFPCAVRRPLLLPILTARLARDDLSVRALATEPGVLTLTAPADWHADVWTNWNRPDDLRA